MKLEQSQEEFERFETPSFTENQESEVHYPSSSGISMTTLRSEIQVQMKEYD